MKKNYTAPEATLINLVVEGMMAASIKLSDETVKTEQDVLSNQKGWDSTDWSGDED